MDAMGCCQGCMLGGIDETDWQCRGTMSPMFAKTVSGPGERRREGVRCRPCRAARRLIAWLTLMKGEGTASVQGRREEKDTPNRRGPSKTWQVLSSAAASRLSCLGFQLLNGLLWG